MKIALASLAFALLSQSASAAVAKVDRVETRDTGVFLVLGGRRLPVCLALPEVFKSTIVTIALNAKAQDKPVAYGTTKSQIGPGPLCINELVF